MFDLTSATSETHANACLSGGLGVLIRGGVYVYIYMYVHIYIYK